MKDLFNIDNPLLKVRRTKIVATLGPASSDKAAIVRLINAGADVFRLNMSHGDHETHRRTFANIQSAMRECGRHVAVLADLMGPKIRVGELEGGSIDLIAGASVTVTVRSVVGMDGLIPCQYEGLARDVGTGDAILLDDGRLELRVLSVDGPDILCTVIEGGRLKSRKGINLPGVAVSAASLTEKDKQDARFAHEIGVDFLALSFVRSARDVGELREFLEREGSHEQIIAKIERPEALKDIDGILEIADGIMVARGDLGVEIQQERVPVVQHELVDRARQRNKPVIIATQMLESMTDSPRPTRAEISDVSHAVFSGADAVMLSAETASGNHPVEAVKVMDRVARQVEAWHFAESTFGSLEWSGRAQSTTLGEAVAKGASQMARDLSVRCLAVPSTSGATVKVISAARPSVPILGLSASEQTLRRISLLWGVVPIAVDCATDEDYKQSARAVALRLELAEKGGTLLLIAGFKPDAGQSEPSITVFRV